MKLEDWKKLFRIVYEATLFTGEALQNDEEHRELWRLLYPLCVYAERIVEAKVKAMTS